MAISDRITSIEEHIKESYQELEGIGIDTTGVNKNLENIPKLIDGYWETLPKVTGEGTSITLDNTKEGKMKIVLKGNTNQEGIPTPDSPQDIHVVSGDNTIVSTNKNLAPTNWASNFVSAINNTNLARLETKDNKNCLFYRINAGYPDYSNKNFTLGMKFKENTRYTISYDAFKVDATQKCLVIAYTDGTIQAGPLFSYVNTWEHQTITTTANKTVDYIFVGYYAGDTYIDIDTWQIEEGTTATEYEEHKEQTYPINLGELELCKIGDYQDYIYKDNGKWYLHKEIEKVVLNGSELGWQLSGGTTNVFQNNNYFSGIYLIQDAFCNYYTNVVNSNITANNKADELLTNGQFTFRDGTTKDRIYFKDTRYTSIDDFKNFLLTNTPILYFVLATSTNTEIANATLISQLDALETAMSYNSQTNISQESNDLASLLNATALEEM